jgi:hypothetical protein
VKYITSWNNSKGSKFKKELGVEGDGKDKLPVIEKFKKRVTVFEDAGRRPESF